ncbi:MAG: hypothetical protein IH944_02710 [Armatimonadetes bacterium]|nr:hypothetical protein [Armatimonadota bacterium]
MSTIATLILLSSLATPLQSHGRDQSGWVQEMVTLYYFPNPIVLAATLNSNGKMVSPLDTKTPDDRAGDQTGADAKKPKSVAGALGEHIDALNALQQKLQAVEDAKVRLVATKDAEDIAKNKQLDANSKVEALEPEVQIAQRNEREAKAEVTEAEEDVSTHSNEPPDETQEERAAREAKLEDAKKRREQKEQTWLASHQLLSIIEKNKDELAIRQERATLDLEGATAERTAAATALSSAQTALNTARTSIADATKALRDARELSQIEAAGRMEKFSRDRVAAKYWKAEAKPHAKDPVERVEIFVYPDSSTIYLRGLPEDVRIVKEIIADFDRPTPQARITLWTLELNLIGNRGRNALSDASTKIEARLTEARMKMARVTMHFRAALNKRVNKIQARALKLHPGLGNGPDGSRFARCFFYEPEVAFQLGLNLSEVENTPTYYYFTRWTLPDPAASTTLGEALLIYMLGTPYHREAVMNEFKCSIEKDDKIQRWKKNNEAWSPEQFMEEISVGNSTSPKAGLTGYQLEVLRALKRTALERFIKTSPDIVGLYSQFSHYFPSLARDFVLDMPIGAKPNYWFCELYIPAENPKSTPDWHRVPLDRQIEAAGIAETMAYVTPALLWFRQEFGISIQAMAGLGRYLKRIKESYESVARVDQAKADMLIANEFRKTCEDWFRRSFPTDESNARIAAADEMLKRIMISLEDDMQKEFVIPTLDGIKKDLIGPGISVGKIDRTSLLATNRYASRVEGNASAELDLAGQERLVDAALALADMISAANGSKVPDMLRKLQGFDQEPTSEFYAVASGMQFKVTPVFDPTGQALRFQFDYVKNTNVLDSDGTNPSLPRIDSHTASMMVQISNMEIRELTRFETNVKLGVPEKRWGGIPFLNSIYPLSEIPIIGWFSRKSGRDAVSQTSIIFVQNAMYPTIGDLSNLLSSGFGVPPLGGGTDWITPHPRVESIPEEARDDGTRRTCGAR